MTTYADIANRTGTWRHLWGIEPAGVAGGWGADMTDVEAEYANVAAGLRSLAQGVRGERVYFPDDFINGDDFADLMERAAELLTNARSDDRR